MSSNSLMNSRFLSLCGLTFLTICNTAVFYSFHEYLLGLGFKAGQAGFLIGLYSLCSMLFYAAASQRITTQNAFRTMIAGMLMIAGCAAAYHFTENYWILSLVRIVGGIGSFCIMASSMVVLVGIIPEGKSGTAFSLYSVALLAPYSVMPALAEMIRPWVDSVSMLYTLTGFLFFPAMGLAYIACHDRTIRIKTTSEKKQPTASFKERKKNLLRTPVLILLLTNCIYFILFSSLFYLYEGYAIKRGITNPGYFFTIQTGVMVAVRFLGSYIFDRFSKPVLVIVSLVITSLCFIMLHALPSPGWIYPVAVAFGLGMGLCVPPLNSLMYLVSEPEWQGYNVNMMMLTVHLGFFTGPFIGSPVIAAGGYSMFLLGAALLTLCGAVLFFRYNPAKAV